MNSRTLGTNITKIKFKNNHVVYENFIKCTVKDYEFNLSYNPTLLSGSQTLLFAYSSSADGDVFYEVTGSKYFGVLKDFTTGSISGSEFSPYVTTVGLYNDAGDLLAIGKMAAPMPLSTNTDVTFLVKWDTQWNPKPYFTPTPSPTRTPAATPSVTPTITVTPSISKTPNATLSVTPTLTTTPSVTPSFDTSPSTTPTLTPTQTPTPTLTPTMTPTVTPTVTPSISTCVAGTSYGIVNNGLTSISWSGVLCFSGASTGGTVLAGGSTNTGCLRTGTFSYGDNGSVIITPFEC